LSEVKTTPVVGGEDYERVLSQALAAKGIEHSSDAEVDFFDDIAVQSSKALASEILRDKQWDMRKAVGQVEEEGPVLVLLDELDRLIGVAFCYSVLVGRSFDYFFIAHQGHIPVFDFRFEKHLATAACDPVHIVAVGDAEVGIEAVVGRQIRRQMPEVPFADTSGNITLALESLGDCDFAFRQARASPSAGPPGWGYTPKRQRRS